MAYHGYYKTGNGKPRRNYHVKPRQYRFSVVQAGRVLIQTDDLALAMRVARDYMLEADMQATISDRQQQEGE